MMSASNFPGTAVIALAIVALTGCSHLQHSDSSGTAPQAILMEGDYPHAVSALKAGKDEEALSLFKAAAKEHPDMAAPYINVGLIEIKRNNLHTAETALLHAATLAPDQPEIYNGLGIIYRRLGRFHDAEAAYLDALRCAPDYANAHLNIGILYEIYLNNLSAAQSHYERYEVLSGGNNDQVKKWIIDVKQRLAKAEGGSQ